MINVTVRQYRKYISIALNCLYLYPAPKPMARTRSFWIATGLVACAALLFAGFFIAFLLTEHSAYLTHAEDLGIMDQAIWSITHGQLFHQTICNTLHDTNCYSLAGIPRFAIHFEPILFLISLLYFVAPHPQTLVVLQTLVVAAGAFPAFWLARLRLRNEWAGVVIALLYLLYPALHWATIFDFHAVTLTAAFLLFLLYFMYTRQTVWLFVFAILAMGCKEEIPIVVAMFALWSILFQRRVRTGLILLLLAIVWTGMGLLVVHLYSPVGHSLLTSRYAYLGSNPLQVARTLSLHPAQILREHVLESHHFTYLRAVLSPTGYLALLAPWIMILALPTLALNMLSSNPQMYSAFFQYEAEIVPILIFATIEAIVLLVWLIQAVETRLVKSFHGGGTIGNRKGRPRYIQYGMLVFLLCYISFSVVRADYGRSTLPFSQRFHWPTVTAHNTLAQQFIDMIPADASVSAQSALVPHMSHRSNIYMFPYGDTSVQYVFLDVTSEIYPYDSSSDYVREAKHLMFAKNYGVVAAQDGYLLLKQGLSSPGIAPASVVPLNSDVDDVFVVPNLPSSFCSFINAAPQTVTHPVQVAFLDPGTTTTTMDLIGFDVDAPNPFSASGASLAVTTYWRMVTPTATPLQILAFMDDEDRKEYGGTTDFPALLWCQTQTWQPGMVVRMTSRPFNVQASHVPAGIAYVSIALLPLLPSPGVTSAARFRLPLRVENAGGTVSVLPGANALQLKPLTIIG